VGVVAMPYERFGAIFNQLSRGGVKDAERANI
jgi:hypothetical protein